MDERRDQASGEEDAVGRLAAVGSPEWADPVANGQLPALVGLEVVVGLRAIYDATLAALQVDSVLHLPARL